MADTSDGGIKAERIKINALKKAEVKNIGDKELKKQLDIKAQLINEKKTESGQKEELARVTKIEENAQIAQKRRVKLDEWFEQNKSVSAQAYVELGTAYMELMGGYVLMVEAMAYEENAGLVWLWRETIGQTVAGQIIAEVASGIAGLPGTAYDKVLRGVGLRQDDIHEIRYSVNIHSETNEITTSVTKDGEPLSEEQQKVFDSGLIAWLEKEKGYTFDEKKRVLHKDNIPLTNKILKKLNVDDKHGLAAFFDSRMGLEIKETPSPKF